MINRTAEARCRAKRFLLANAGAAALAPAVFVCMAITLSNWPAILAQTPAVRAPEFDAASIKPISCVGRCGVGGGTERLIFKPGMVSSRGVNGITPRGLILEGYYLAEYQLIGGPSWLDSDRIAVQAKAGTDADQAQQRQML